MVTNKNSMVPVLIINLEINSDNFESLKILTAFVYANTTCKMFLFDKLKNVKP